MEPSLSPDPSNFSAGLSRVRALYGDCKSMQASGKFFRTNRSDFPVNIDATHSVEMLGNHAHAQMTLALAVETGLMAGMQMAFIDYFQGDRIEGLTHLVL